MTSALKMAGELILRLPGSRVAGSFGIVLSGVAVLLLMFSGWKGGEMVYRHGVGIFGGDR